MASEIVETRNPETSSQQAGPTRSKLVQRLLAASENLPQFINDLLTTQAVVAVGTEAAGFIIERHKDGFSLRVIAHIRPDNSGPETRAAAVSAFQEIIKPCVEQAKDGAIEIQGGDNAPEPQFCLVTLLRNEGEVVAVSAVITRCMNTERAQQRLMSLQLVAGYFELYSLRRASEQAQVVAQSHQHVLQLATAVATAEGFESAAMNLCNELATRTGAARVALGWLKGENVKLRAVSHTEQFDKKQEKVRQLEQVMEEAIDQEEPVHFDPEGKGTENVSRAAAALSRSEGGIVVMTLPLRHRADVVGAITLEFPAGHKLTPQAANGIAVAVDLLAPQLYDRHENDRWLITKAGVSAKKTGKMMLGRQHTLGKLIAISIVAALLFICLYSPMYHVSAPFQFDAVDKRKLQAPFEARLLQVLVRPGDHVQKGELLAKMDTFDLQQKLLDAQAQVNQHDAEYHKAASDDSKQADAQIALDQENGAKAQVAEYQYLIAIADIRAPFDGVIIDGDLIDQINAPKKEGDDLFTIAADQGLRAMISVSERDVQMLKPGQHGNLATTSLPTEKYPFTLERIVPLGQAKEGDNVFTVYATLDKQDPTWAPGLGGEVRIDVRQRPLIWTWTHKLIDYVRLKLWI